VYGKKTQPSPGSVHVIEKKKIDDKLLRALITRNGSENVSPP
jgi:hypothetical protein